MTEKNYHPGWVVKFSNGFLACAHGLHIMDAFYAEIFSSVQEANGVLLEFLTENPNFGTNYSIVEAWEPTCAKLRFELNEVKKTNSIDSYSLYEATESIRFALENIEKMNTTSESGTVENTTI